MHKPRVVLSTNKKVVLNKSTSALFKHVPVGETVTINIMSDQTGEVVYAGKSCGADIKNLIKILRGRTLVLEDA